MKTLFVWDMLRTEIHAVSECGKWIARPIRTWRLRRRKKQVAFFLRLGFLGTDPGAIEEYVYGNRELYPE